MTRREWLALALAAGIGARRQPRVAAQAREALTARIGRVIRDYEQHGPHRTGTDVDRRSGDWLGNEIRAIGAMPQLESFTLRRIDPQISTLVVDGRQIDGLPLFDGGFTDPSGVSGTLGSVDSDADIAVIEAAPNTAAAGVLGGARRSGRHRAIVCVTRGGRPGLCPSNADSFLAPFGPPVLQVSSEQGAWLAGHAERRSRATLVAAVRHTATEAFNVTTSIRGRESSSPPLVVMTPRSGWYACASERGGGIACWLELMRTLHERRPPRDVLFVASSGHELGHLGIDAYVARRSNIVSRSAGWMHLGANIGAAVRPEARTRVATESADARHATPVVQAGTTIQASDDAFETLLAGAMDAAGIGIARRNPRGTIPGGEAEVVHRGGGRYVSVIGANAWFHNPDDRGPQVVNLDEIARFTEVFARVASAIMQ